MTSSLSRIPPRRDFAPNKSRGRCAERRTLLLNSIEHGIYTGPLHRLYRGNTTSRTQRRRRRRICVLRHRDGSSHHFLTDGTLDSAVGV